MIQGIRANELLPPSLLRAWLHSFPLTGIDTEEGLKINFANDTKLLQELAHAEHAQEIEDDATEGSASQSMVL